MIFDNIADQNYDIVPIYYYLPADIPSGDSSSDQMHVWMPDDELVIQGLIAKIYQYKEDIREEKQVQYVEALKGSYRRGSVPPAGGTSRVMLSRKRFKTRYR